ncbi:MAG TPA: uroporphyrinogen decarboxylase family protein [Rectinemataceae bacterium]
MTKRERLSKTFRGEKTDRVPVSIYQHSTVHDRGVEPFVEYTLAFHKRFDPDYVKVMYDELYDTPVNFQFAVDPSVWGMLEPLDPHKAAFGRYLESLKRVRASVDPDTPVIATIFSPFHIAVRLAWSRLSQDCREHGAEVAKGLEAITASTCALVKAARDEAGVDGFFLGAFGAEDSWLSEAEYERLEAPFDRQVLAAMKGSEFTFVHAHGEEGAHFGIFTGYDCKALSWEDRQGGPDILTARSRTDKVLVGGIDHVMAQTCAADAVYAQARDAIAVSGGRNFILACGCTFLPGTPAENMLALKKASLDAAEGR